MPPHLGSFTLSVQTLTPTVPHPRNRLTPESLIRSPQTLSGPPPLDIASALLHHMRVTTVQGSLPPGPGTEHWLQVSHCIIPWPFMLSLPEGEKWGIIRASSRLRENSFYSEILHTVPSQHTKQNAIQMCIFKEQLQLLI